MAVHFCTADAFRTWLAANSRKETELLVRFYKKNARKPGLTYAEALDEALCYGWIDGVRKNFDAESYTIRFSPRKPRSIWSKVNIAHAQRLIRAKRMQPPGAAAFAARQPKRSGIYSFENKPRRLPADLEQRFRAVEPAWRFFNAQPPGYCRTILWWIVSAKQPTTRQRRLDHTMAESAAGRRVNLLSPYRKDNDR